MKRKLLFTAVVLLATIPALMAWADFEGDLRRFLGIERVFNSSDRPVPKFLNGMNVDGTDYTTTELNLALGAGDSGALVTGITAGTTQTQAGATLLTGRYNNVTTVGTAGDGVRLPTAVAGLSVTVRNSAAANTLKAYPFSGDSINALAANLSVDIPALSETTFTAINATVWYSEPTALYLSSPTTLTGGLQLKAAASAGNTTTLITNASQAAARTYTIPDAGASANFVLSEGAATINGVKTFGSIPVFPTGGITAGATTLTEAQLGALDPTLGAAVASHVVSLDANGLFDGAKLQGHDSSLAAAGSAYAPSADTEAIMNGGTYQIAANRLQALGYIEFEAVVLVGAINATDTLTVNVRLGGIGGQAVSGYEMGNTTAANDYVVFRGRVNVRSIVTTTCTMTSIYEVGAMEAGAAVAAEKGFVPAFTADSTAAIDLVVTGEFSTASGTNSATLEVFNVNISGA